MLDGFSRWIGYGLCHQLPERSFFGAGAQVPVCARDTGIYVGFVASLIVLAILHRGERPRGFPAWPVWVVMGLFLAVFGWDGVSSYAGFRETTNWIRLMTGLGVGFSAAAVIAPMLNDELWRSAGSGRLLAPPVRTAAWLSSIPITAALVWWGAPLLGVLYPHIVTLSILVTLSTINLVVVAMIPAFDRQAGSAKDLVLPIGISLLIAFAEVWAAGWLRDALIGAASFFA